MLRPLAGDRVRRRRSPTALVARRARRAAGIRLERAFDLRAGRGEIPQRRLQPGGMPHFVVPSRELDDSRGGGERVVEPAEMRAGVGDDLVVDEGALVGHTRHRRESRRAQPRSTVGQKHGRQVQARLDIAGIEGHRLREQRFGSCRIGPRPRRRRRLGRDRRCACRARPRVRAAAPRRRAPPWSNSKCARDSTSARSSGRSRASASNAARASSARSGRSASRLAVTSPPSKPLAGRVGQIGRISGG